MVEAMRFYLISTTTLDSIIRWWLPVVVLVVGNVQVVQATCGDHLGWHGSMTLGQAFVTEKTSPLPFPIQPTKVPLCSGPNCHRHVPVPIPSHDPIIPVSFDAILIPGIEVQNPGKESLICQQQGRTSLGWTRRVFRPPRQSDLRTVLIES